MLKVWTPPLNKVSSKALGGSQLGGGEGRYSMGYKRGGTSRSRGGTRVSVRAPFGLDVVL